MRAWSVLVVGLLLTAAASVWVRSVPPSYVGSAQVVLVRASAKYVPNPLSTGVGSLIDVAAVVDRAVNGVPDPRSVVSGDLTLADQGIRDATVIRLANDGSQWADDFNRPVIDISVVAPTAAQAHAHLEGAIARVTETLRQLQRDMQVAPVDRVFVRLAPSSNRVLRTGGDPQRALLACLLLGGSLTAAGVRWTLRPRA